MTTLTTRHEIYRNAKEVKLLVLDVDGVLTDGKLWYGASGEELKSFSTLDGQGIKLLQNTDISVAIITARFSSLVAKRAEELRIQNLYMGVHNKLACLRDLQKQLGISMNGTAYVGDDLPDLACIIEVGLGVAVNNAHPIILDRAFCQTTKVGGAGAVREVCDWILEAQGLMPKIVESFLP